MIYVILEDETGKSGKELKELKERNELIKKMAAEAVNFKTYGQIVSSNRDVRQSIENNDKTLYLFAHGNVRQFGKFWGGTAGVVAENLLDELKDKLGIFKSVNSYGKGQKVKTPYIQELVLNSCESAGIARELATQLRGNLESYQSLTVVGTKGRAFTDLNGQIRVAKSDQEANEIDQVIKEKGSLNRERYTGLINKKCHPASMGLEKFPINQN